MPPPPDDLFTVLPPTGRPLPVVASLPHSGMCVPEPIAASYRPELLAALPNTDWYLRELYGFLPSMGVTVLQANYSRYVVDLNRPPESPLLGAFWSSAIPRSTAFGDAIYAAPPSSEELHARLASFHAPYHEKLTQLLNECADKTGNALLLDLHSFMGPIEDDVCLGDRNAQSCSEQTSSRFESAFRKQGFTTVRNKVFTGGYITRRCGALGRVQALQIELRYTNYLPGDQLDTGMVPVPDQALLRTTGRRLEAALSAALAPLAT